MIDRSKGPSSIVRPQTEITKVESATAASRRQERVALLTDRAHVGAALARASQWIKRRNARPQRGSIEQKAVAIAMRSISGRRRWSKLAEWLSADVSQA